MEYALLHGDSFPPAGVEDTPANRGLWNQISKELDEMKRQGIVPELPFEYTDTGD
jgi:hypothetical protein